MEFVLFLYYYNSTGPNYENIVYCELSDGTSTQFSNYFHSNYIPHFTACQQFQRFSFFLN